MTLAVTKSTESRISDKRKEKYAARNHNLIHTNENTHTLTERQEENTARTWRHICSETFTLLSRDLSVSLPVFLSTRTHGHNTRHTNPNKTHFNANHITHL